MTGPQYSQIIFTDQHPDREHASWPTTMEFVQTAAGGLDVTPMIAGQRQASLTVRLAPGQVRALRAFLDALDAS